MSPFVKYTLARLSLFAVVAALLIALPIPISILLKLAIAVIVSAILSWFLLGELREQFAQQLVGSAQRRQTRRRELRAALSGSDESDTETAAGRDTESPASLTDTAHQRDPAKADEREAETP
jgi:Protein of unknown function (DUF4229)